MSRGWRSKNPSPALKDRMQEAITIMARIINATPHEVRIVCPDGAWVIPPSGTKIRLEEEDIREFSIDSVPIRGRRYGVGAVVEQLQKMAIEGETVIVIVPLPLLLHIKEEAKRLQEGGLLVVAPDTGRGAIRDAKGNIVGVQALVMLE